MSTHRNCKLTECLGRPRCNKCLAMDAKEDGGSRTEFEAAAYRWLRNPQKWTQDFLIINDDHTKFTHTDELDAKLAAAMGWPTVPEVKS